MSPGFLGSLLHGVSAQLRDVCIRVDVHTDMSGSPPWGYMENKGSILNSHSC